jgi:thiamine transport system ATP-binding protein
VSSSEPILRVDRLGAAWGRSPVLTDVTFQVGAGELFVLLGPNGSGKTTLLRCLAGLEPTTAGRIYLAGRDVTHVPAHRRGIGLMFQDPALFPHRTVYENIAYGPLLQRWPRSAIDAEVQRQVALLGLAGFEDRSPDALSGGERQRVALARTLAARPRLVLLDEPFASIDPELKVQLRAEFRRALRSAGAAAIHVTHDRAEGLFLGDRVGLLFDGTLESVGPPEAVFGAPASVRAARFLGYNLFREGDGWVAIDPRDTRLARSGPRERALTVVAVGSTGGERLVVGRLTDGAPVESRGPLEAPAVAPGDTVFAVGTRSVAVANPAPVPPKTP